MISFDNGFFFSKNGLDFKNNVKYNKNLDSEVRNKLNLNNSLRFSRN